MQSLLETSGPRFARSDDRVDMSNVFEKLTRLREFEKRHLRFLHTLEDLDTVRIVGRHEMKGTPLRLSEIYHQGLGSSASIVRRVKVLRDEGHLIARKVPGDTRMLMLVLSPELYRIYALYAVLVLALNE